MAKITMTIEGGIEGGVKEWRLPNKQLHREDGPAVEQANGTKVWYHHGELHREDGPAIELPDGSKIWCIYGKIHRADGPAVIRPDGSLHWWFCGEEMGPVEHFVKAQELIQNG